MPTDQSDTLAVVMQKSDAYRIIAALRHWAETHAEAATAAVDNHERNDHERHATRAVVLAARITHALGH